MENHGIMELLRLEGKDLNICVSWFLTPDLFLKILIILMKKTLFLKIEDTIFI